MSKSTKAIIILLIIAICVIPLTFISGNYEGADGMAEETITETNPDYKPWFKPIFEPKSGEIESLLFALQASLGAVVIGYYFGYQKGKKNAANR